jgi:hypothetical protein
MRKEDESCLDQQEACGYHGGAFVERAERWWWWFYVLRGNTCQISKVCNSKKDIRISSGVSLLLILEPLLP